MSAKDFDLFDLRSKAQAASRGGRTAPGCDAMVNEIMGLCRTIASSQWTESAAGIDQVITDVQRVGRDLAEHIAMMEAPGGMIDRVGGDCPRLTPRIGALCREHLCIRACLAEIEDRLFRYRRGACSAVAVREQAAGLVGAMRAHQDKGNELVLEAYDSEIGTGD